MELLIPVAMAAATLLVIFQISFARRVEQDRGICNSDTQRPRA